MTTTAQQAEFHTLLDWNLLRGPKGGELEVAKLMYQNNQFNQVVPYREANDGVGHKIGIQTSLPTAERDKYGKRHIATHGTTAVITETPARAVSYWKVLRALAELDGGESMMKEDADHAEALAQLVEGDMIYGNHDADEEQPTGFETRHNALTGEIGKYTIDGGGGADGGAFLTSILLVGMGPGAVYGIFPQGSKTAGLDVLDMGIQKDQNNLGTIWVYEGEFSHYYGMAEEDHRWSVRICNINKNGLINGTGATKGLPYLMRRAFSRIAARFRLKIGPMGVNHYWVMSSTVFDFLLEQTQSGVSQGAGITWENFDNGFVQKTKAPMYSGMPIIFSDQFVSETVVS